MDTSKIICISHPPVSPSSPSSSLTLLKDGAEDVPGAVLQLEQASTVQQLVVLVVRGEPVDQEQDGTHDQHGHGDQDPGLAGRETMGEDSSGIAVVSKELNYHSATLNQENIIHNKILPRTSLAKGSMKSSTLDSSLGRAIMKVYGWRSMFEVKFTTSLLSSETVNAAAPSSTYRGGGRCYS